MGNPNSLGEVYLELVLSVLDQDPLGITSTKNLMRDRLTLVERSEHEGLSFLTKTLPLLGKALDSGLVSGHFYTPTGFKTAHGCASIPAFLQTYFKCIFKEDGGILDSPSEDAVKHLRQVCFMLYKLELPYTEEQEARVARTFVTTDGELPVDGDFSCSNNIAAASYIVREVLSGFNPFEILPRHGPGSVATGERQEGKWEFSRLFSCIHRVYPYYDYYISGWAEELADRLGWWKSLERHESGTAKVVLVPKDSRGPRLISCEPLEFQWIQQGLGRALMNHLESSNFTGGVINFTDQEINRKHALESSRTQEYATLDLKDASDRVSITLVKELFQHNEDVLNCLMATRTRSTKLPSGEVLTLKKFAPMGSALCFPVEALCFWAIIVGAVSNKLKMRPRSVGRRVFVYGDDIIIPVDWASTAIQSLEFAGLIVNKSKSCVTGNFRESCGMDAFNGVCVTPTRLKKPWIEKRSADTYSAYLAFANNMAERGYAGCAAVVWKRLEGIYGFIPYCVHDSPYPGKVVPNASRAISLNKGNVRMRWNIHFQRVEMYVRKIRSPKHNTQLDDWTRLLRNLVMPQLDDPSHVVSPRSTQIKMGWSPV